jgi:hypothetical protein
MKYQIEKKYTESVKLNDGTLKSFTSGLVTEVDVTSAEQLVAESDKLLAQVQWLVQRDIANTFSQGA